MKLPVLSLTDRHMTFTSMSVFVDIDRHEKSKKCKVIITLCCLQSIKTYQTTFFVLSVAEVGYTIMEFRGQQFSVNYHSIQKRDSEICCEIP